MELYSAVKTKLWQLGEVMEPEINILSKVSHVFSHKVCACMWYLSPQFPRQRGMICNGSCGKIGLKTEDEFGVAGF